MPAPQALPTTTEKTWNLTLINRAVASAGSALTEHRNVLLDIYNGWIATGKWFLKGSSNSVGAGMDTTVRISFPSDLVWSSSGNRSWFVLGNDALGTGAQVCFSCDGSDYRYMSITVSPAAGFTGGTIGARPTATDEGPLTEIPATGNPPGWLSGDTASRAYKAHHLFSSDGQNTRTIVYAGGNPIALIAFDRLSGARAAGLFVGRAWGGATSSRLNATAFLAAGAVPNFAMRIYGQGRSWIGEFQVPGANGQYDVVAQTAANPYSGAWTVVPLYVGDAASGSEAGYIPDEWAGSVTKVNGDRYNSVSPIWLHHDDLVEYTDGTTFQTS